MIKEQHNTYSLEFKLQAVLLSAHPDIQSKQVVVNNQSNQSAADEIRKLASLKNQGLLTIEEFNKRKGEILNNI